MSMPSLDWRPQKALDETALKETRLVFTLRCLMNLGILNHLLGLDVRILFLYFCVIIIDIEWVYEYETEISEGGGWRGPRGVRVCTPSGAAWRGFYWSFDVFSWNELFLGWPVGLNVQFKQFVT